jgi:DNA-binding CsgD family transcriptional regulator
MNDPFLDLFARMGLPHRKGRGLSYMLEANLQAALLELARREQKQPDELVVELLSSALAQRQGTDVLQQRWQSLSPREQEVVACTCLGSTNRQMAARLGISEETIKTHLQNALVKFHLHGKSQLRIVLAQWDFSAWEERPGTGAWEERPGTSTEDK